MRSRRLLRRLAATLAIGLASISSNVVEASPPQALRHLFGAPGESSPVTVQRPVEREARVQPFANRMVPPARPALDVDSDFDITDPAASPLSGSTRATSRSVRPSRRNEIQRTAHTQAIPLSPLPVRDRVAQMDAASDDLLDDLLQDDLPPQRTPREPLPAAPNKSAVEDVKEKPATPPNTRTPRQPAASTGRTPQPSSPLSGGSFGMSQSGRQPMTLASILNNPYEEALKQQREQAFCTQMWQCAGGRCLSNRDRILRDWRRNYEVIHLGPCGNNCNRPPSFWTLFWEPIIYERGIFGWGRSQCGCGTVGCAGCQYAAHGASCSAAGCTTPAHLWEGFCPDGGCQSVPMTPHYADPSSTSHHYAQPPLIENHSDLNGLQGPILYEGLDQNEAPLPILDDNSAVINSPLESAQHTPFLPLSPAN
ncbi:MAG: hypothetical protein KDA60_15155 [Planctomycetales bacterium]|nr:hypothetical protein [Planctomycetales bacterium]